MRAPQSEEMSNPYAPPTDLDLNIFVVTFNGMKDADQSISAGDPYSCLKCRAILNKYSTVLNSK